MKKVLLTLLAVIVILGALGGAGYAGYRIGFAQGASGSGNFPAYGHMDPSRMPMERFGNDFGRGFDQYHSPMMTRRGDFGMNFFSPFRLLWNIAIFALIVWFVYWLFTKSGWRITRTSQDKPTTEGN